MSGTPSRAAAPLVRFCRHCNRTHEISFDNAIRMRRWNDLKWECPHCVLTKEFPLILDPERRVAVIPLFRGMPKERFERHSGSVLAYGLMNQSRNGIPFDVAFGPELDPTVEDGALRYRHEGIAHTFPLQLKRVTRDDMDPHDELNERIADLTRYQLDDLIVGISIERTFTLELDRVVVPKMRVMELWLIRSASPDGITWGLNGFTPGSPDGWKRVEFVYPSVLPEDQVKHLGGD